MRFRGDDRAVTVQIGAVILLGFLVVSLSLYQATVVPNENRQIEFQHNQRVQSDMLEVRNAILGTAATGSAAPAIVELGAQYPTRTVAVNPSPPSGTPSTSELGNISVKNATADDASTSGADYPETADFWNGTTRNYTTKSLEYRPSYANYDNAPTTVYENGLVYNRFRSGNVTRSGQPVVAGTRISLVALDGELSRGGSSSLLADPRAVSVSTRTISITNASATENVSVVVPSELEAQDWTDLLNETGDYDPAADPNDGAYVYRVADRPNGVELYFERGETYQLKLSKIGVGSGVGATEPAYLTSAEGLMEAPFENRTYPFVVESRDKYNNPVGTQVVAAADRGTVPPGTVLEPGRYRYQYFAPTTSGLDAIRVTYNDSGDPAYDPLSTSFEGNRVENVRYEVNVQPGGGSGGGSGGGGGGGDSGSIVYSGDATVQSNNPGNFRFGIENTGGSDVEIARFGISGNLADRLDNDGNPEFIVNGGGTNGIANRNGFYEPGVARYPLDTNAIVQGGNTATIELYGLKRQPGNSGNYNPINNLDDLTQTTDPGASELTIVIEFTDGTTQTFYFA